MYLRRILSLGTLIIALTGMSTAVVAQDNDAEISQLFKKATELFRRGKIEDSAAALEKVLAMRPDSDLALHLRDQVKYGILLQMLEDLNTHDMDAAARMLSGSARSMGIEVGEPQSAEPPAESRQGWED